MITTFSLVTPQIREWLAAYDAAQQAQLRLEELRQSPLAKVAELRLAQFRREDARRILAATWRAVRRSPASRWSFDQSQF